MNNTAINDQLQELQAIYFPNEIIFNLILSFFLGLLISFVYKKTHRGMSYSQSFMITNIFLSLIVFWSMFPFVFDLVLNSSSLK